MKTLLLLLILVFVLPSCGRHPLRINHTNGQIESKTGIKNLKKLESNSLTKKSKAVKGAREMPHRKEFSGTK